MRENEYQQELKKTIRKRIPGCVVKINDGNDIQGFPDLTIFYKGRYAMLEAKRCEKAKHQKNQDYYIEMFGEHAFSAFIFPENEKEILDGMERALGVER